MSPGWKIGRSVLIVVVLSATFGCSKALDYFRSKHPDPPAGAFPSRVGKWMLEHKGDKEEDKNPNCTRADPLHCWGYYLVPGDDDPMARINYYMQIYDSPEEAKERLEAYVAKDVPWDQDISWEDGGQKIGRLLLKNSIHRDGDQMLGICSLSYAKNSMFITISHGYECEPVRQFLKDLVAITD